MVNFKSEVYTQLARLESRANISDDFPEEWESIQLKPAVQYTEEDNRAYEMSGNKCISSYLRYQIDIYGVTSLSTLACDIDALLAGNLGLKRTMCRDNNEAGLKHKIMKYEGIRNDRTGYMYTPN